MLALQQPGLGLWPHGFCLSGARIPDRKLASVPPQAFIKIVLGWDRVGVAGDAGTGREWP